MSKFHQTYILNHTAEHGLQMSQCSSNFQLNPDDVSTMFSFELTNAKFTVYHIEINFGEGYSKKLKVFDRLEDALHYSNQQIAIVRNDDNVKIDDHMTYDLVTELFGFPEYLIIVSQDYAKGLLINKKSIPKT
jgi:hypothetical protein